jgi:hypothetical protein
MHVRVDAPFPPAELAREELYRVLSSGFISPCCGEAGEFLAHLEQMASRENRPVPAAEPHGRRLRLRGLFSGLNLFPA